MSLIVWSGTCNYSHSVTNRSLSLSRESYDPSKRKSTHQEMLLPSHKHIVAFGQIVVVKRIRVECFIVFVPECCKFALKLRKSIQRCLSKCSPPELCNYSKPAYVLCIFRRHAQAYPMLSVDLFICIPFTGQKWILFRYNFAIKERRQHGIFGG